MPVPDDAAEHGPRFDELRALFTNCTLKRSPERSHTDGLVQRSAPGPSYLDPESGGPDNDFTNRNTSFMTFNLMHLAAMLKRNAGVPAFGNQRTEWDAGCMPDLENPEHR